MNSKKTKHQFEPEHSLTVTEISRIKLNQVIPKDEVVESIRKQAKQPEANRTLRSHRKLKLFKDKFFEWSSNSTAHGISNICRLESRPLKIIWMVCFLTSFSYCSYTIVNVLVAFFEYGVVINQQVVTELPVDFPVVTVCNLNAFDKRNAKSYMNQVLARNNISYERDRSLINITPTEVNNLIKASIIGNKNLTREDIINIGFKIDYMLLTCYFNNVPCNQSDFRWLYDFDYTNCWQFNR